MSLPESWHMKWFFYRLVASFNSFVETLWYMFTQYSIVPFICAHSNRSVSYCCIELHNPRNRTKEPTKCVLFCSLSHPLWPLWKCYGWTVWLRWLRLWLCLQRDRNHVSTSVFSWLHINSVYFEKLSLERNWLKFWKALCRKF